jgi:hypothetical protein
VLVGEARSLPKPYKGGGDEERHVRYHRRNGA